MNIYMTISTAVISSNLHCTVDGSIATHLVRSSARLWLQLIAFYSNYGAILYRMRDIATYW